MDKVIGRALLDGLVPLGERILCVSGRLSFELVQKAAVAGAPILVGVGAPSSLAISLADDRGMTLCGFARRGSVNVYTHPERVRDAERLRRRHQVDEPLELLLGRPRADRGPDQAEGRDAAHDAPLRRASRATSASGSSAFHETSVERPRGRTSRPRSASCSASPAASVAARSCTQSQPASSKTSSEASAQALRIPAGKP